MRGRTWWVAALLLITVQCVTSLRPDPTPERPWVGCIADSPFVPFVPRQKLSASGARMLPEVVRVIGTTSIEDGERWKVLRAGEFNVKNWQPWAKGKIQFAGCGPEAEAVREVMSFSSR